MKANQWYSVNDSYVGIAIDESNIAILSPSAIMCRDFRFLLLDVRLVNVNLTVCSVPGIIRAAIHTLGGRWIYFGSRGDSVEIFATMVLVERGDSIAIDSFELTYEPYH